jgi:predicted nuclease of predicted toxin-antitoxin system
LRIVIDMNLSPVWTDTLRADGHDVVHWRDIGKPNSKDEAILEWAAQNRRAVFTADLDFGATVVRRRLHAPDVIQLRLANTDPVDAGKTVIDALRQQASRLAAGAVLTIEAQRARLRPGPSTMDDDKNG